MSLSKRYGIPEDAVKKMIKDGWITCSAPMYEKIYDDFVKSTSCSYKSLTAVYNEVAEKNHVSEKTVRDVVHKFK